MGYLDILNETRQNMATANPFENIMRGAQSFNQIQNQLLQNQSAQQTLDQNAAMNPLLMQSRQAELQGQQIQNEAGQLKIDDFQKKERLGQLYRASQALKPFIDKGDLQGASTVAAKLTDFGLPQETAAEVQRLVQIGDADTIRGHINTIESIARNMTDSTTSYGAQESVIDGEGNVFLATTKRNSNGQIEPVMVPLGSAQKPVGKVSFTTGAGVSFQDQKAAEVRAKIAGAQGEADVEREMKPVTEGLTEAEKERNKNIQEWRKTQADLAISAQSGLQNTEQMLKLLDQIGTGKPEAAVEWMKDKFGMQNVKAEQFGMMARRQLLQDIKALGSNPTEGERAYLMSLMPSLERGEEVNKEMLNGIKRVQQNAIKRGRWLKANPGKGAEDYIDTFGDFDETYTPTGTADDRKKRLEELRRKANL